MHRSTAGSTPPWMRKSPFMRLSREQRFGIKHVIDVLRGADTERIRSLRHDRLSTYGIGSDKSEQE